MSDEDDQVDVAAELALTDPSEDEEEAQACVAPPVAKATSDANRYTIYAPYDRTVLSLGKGSAWIKDDGITGKTKKHIHFEVKDEAKTIVVLGGPSLDAGLCSWEGNFIAAQNEGFAMVTDANAWQEAKEQHVILCSEGDVVVRSAGEKKVLVQADGGDLKLAAGESIVVGAKKNVQIYGHSAAKMEDPRYKTPVAKELEQKFEASWTQTATSAFDNIQTVYGAISSALSMTRKKGKWHKPEPTVKNAKEVVAVLADIAKMVAAFWPKDETGKVEIIAENDAGIVAGKGLELFGKTSVGISSLVTCDIIGGTTGMKALTYGGVWAGVMASLKGGVDVCVQAEHGEAELVASKDITIESQSAGVKIEGKECVQMIGEEGSAGVWGKTWTYIGAGHGAGFGAQFTPSLIKIGLAARANKLDDPGIKTLNQIQIEDGRIGAIVSTSSVLIEKDALTLKGDKVKVMVDGVGLEITSGGSLVKIG
jgi:hypothetical protein